MDVSFVRTDRKKAVHLTVKPFAAFVERVKVDTKRQIIKQLRETIANFGQRESYEVDSEIPMVYVSAVLAKDASGSLVPASYNGMVALHVDGLLREADRKAVKDAARMMPMTLAAMTGADGQSVEVLVAVRQAESASPDDTAAGHSSGALNLADGTAAGHSSGTLNLADGTVAGQFYQLAYNAVFSVYSSILPSPIQRLPATAWSCFRLPLDPEPYYCPTATPMVVASHPLPATLGDGSPQSDTRRPTETDAKLYADYERMYRRASEAAHSETADVIDSQRYEAYLTELACRLCDDGMPEEEAVVHIVSHHKYKKEFDESTLRAIVEAVYAENRPRHTGETTAIGQTTRRLIDFLTTRYVFRNNVVMGYVEYRPNNTWVTEWKACDEEVVNGMTIEARLADIDARDKDVRRYVHSDRVQRYDPIQDYLWAVHGQWDGRTDHIGRVARLVPTATPQWERWFRKWLLSMVAQWLGRTRHYGNALVPLLISAQGDGKTQFCKRLLPPELSWGYLEHLNLSEKRATLQAMHQFLLINIDEFNQVTAKVQEGFLKNVIQMDSVKIKRPYGRHVEEFQRLASFIATTNMADVLADPTGNRRFIGVELTAPIDNEAPINYTQLYAQAMQAVLDGEQYWLSHDEVHELMAHNRQFQQVPPAVSYFREYFEAVDDERDGQWLSATAIFQRLRRHAGAGLNVKNVATFGRYLTAIPNLKSRRTSAGQMYLVREKS